MVLPGLFFLSEDSCILLDAGEGTSGQIIRFYGKEASNVFRKIKGIYLSHMHADHHIGECKTSAKSHRLIIELNFVALQVSWGFSNGGGALWAPLGSPSFC